MLSPATIKKIGTAVKSGLSRPEAFETCKTDVLTDCETHNRKKIGAFGATAINWSQWIQWAIILLTDLEALAPPAVPVTPPPPTPPTPPLP